MFSADFMSGLHDFTQHLTSSAQAYFDSFSWRLHLGVNCARACGKNPFWASLRHLSAELSNWTNNVNWWSTSFNEKSISKLDVKPWRVLSKIPHRSEETFDQILIFHIVILPFLFFCPSHYRVNRAAQGLEKFIPHHCTRNVKTCTPLTSPTPILPPPPIIVRHLVTITQHTIQSQNRLKPVRKSTCCRRS